MGSGRAAAATGPIPKINSETNLAVQLLLAVRDGTTCKPSQPSAHQHHLANSLSTTSSDIPADTSDESDSTQCITPSAVSPAVQHKLPTPISASPCVSATPAHSRNDPTSFKYTREERQEALQRFREKKRRRQFRKRVRYMVRKRLAETRPRYKGRFSKPPPGENYDDGTPGSPTLDKDTPAPLAPSIAEQAAVKE